ncbi:MAG: hypothetical protein U1U88_002093 [Lawsonella clevelandensis]
MTIALCTKYVGLQHGITPIAPTVVLMDPRTAQPLATWELHKNGLLGGVYGYLDEQDRVVMTEGNKLLENCLPSSRTTFHQPPLGVLRC